MNTLAATSIRRIVIVLFAALGAAAAAAHAQAPPEAIEYYATDALGSVRVVFTPTGQVLGRSDYLPFGETLNQSGTLPRQRFTGQERDGEAGLDYFNARDLQARTGRMNAPDPVFGDAMTTPQRWNRYSYVMNNPLRFTDPTGKEVQVENLGDLDPWRDWDDMSGYLYNWQASPFSLQMRDLSAQGYSFAEGGGGQVFAYRKEDFASLIPGVVKDEIAAAVARSNAPTCGGPGFIGPCQSNADTTGENHEEGGIWLRTDSGLVFAFAAWPGERCPNAQNKCDIAVGNSQNQLAKDIMAPTLGPDNIVGSYHVHPGDPRWNQEPSSSGDLNNIDYRLNLVIGAGNHTVYLYLKDLSFGFQMNLGTFLRR